MRRSQSHGSQRKGGSSQKEQPPQASVGGRANRNEVCVAGREWARADARRGGVAVGKAAGWGYRHRPTVPLEDGNGTEIQTGASRLTVFRVLRHLCCAGPSSMWAHQGSYRRTLPLWALATLCSHSGPTRTGLQRPKEPRGAEWLDGIKMESGLPFPLVTVTHTRVMNQPCQHRGRPQ